MTASFIVDIPATDEYWEHVKTFSSRQEAIDFCREKFGADEDGKVCLITAADSEPDCSESEE